MSDVGAADKLLQSNGQTHLLGLCRVPLDVAGGDELVDVTVDVSPRPLAIALDGPVVVGGGVAGQGGAPPSAPGGHVKGKVVVDDEGVEHGGQ